MIYKKTISLYSQNKNITVLSLFVISHITSDKYSPYNHVTKLSFLA